MSVRESFAGNLTGLCAAEESIAAVCRATQINRQQFNRYLSGASLPSERNLQKICAHFGISESELFRAPSKYSREDTLKVEAPWSSEDARATLKRIYREAPTSVEPGLYFVYFAYPADPNSVVRSTLIVRREGNLSTFRRLTGLAEAKGSWWSRFLGDHQGIILERRHWLYLVALNRVASQEPTLLVLRWVPVAEPVLGGFATILTPDGPTITAAVVAPCGPRMTLRAAIRASHVYSIDDAALDPTLLDVLDEQCQNLTAMVRRLDLTVTPSPRAARSANGRR